VPVDEFVWSKSFRRIWAANGDLESQIVPAKATSEQYTLFRRYIDARHYDGGMADMTVLDFTSMIDESFVDTRIAEYRLDGKPPGVDESDLAAAVLFDILDDGLSLIYSFFDPEVPRRSLGTYVILDSIRRAQRLGLSYVYLGYWVKGSGKMAYKGRFLPQERLMREGWVRHSK
jgi:arginine-tRNA-protein transferase